MMGISAVNWKTSGELARSANVPAVHAAQNIQITAPNILVVGFDILAPLLKNLMPLNAFNSDNLGYFDYV
ncbi:hypothetical protein [Corynebacterium caspium]|uniref:hypothetical protein n=1 Tax=Corynebacterium caspium TaxID=234828 RepID=UPI0003A19BD5|nr:hypothetical protein [Corynebacterium caspium]WKD58520.1 hypothetical protein CCASP_00425 [Corynebacterium caspium DSM 44850]